MSALGYLVGMECAECRRRGHRCQAQMLDGEEALCLRCANGEECAWARAQRMETPARLRDGEDRDAALRPLITKADREAGRAMARAERERMRAPETRREIMADAARLSAAELVEKWGIRSQAAGGMRTAAAQRRGPAQRDPHAGGYDPERLRQVLKRVADHYGVMPETLLRGMRGSAGRLNGPRRAVAMRAMQLVCGASYAQLGVFFGVSRFRVRDYIARASAHDVAPVVERLACEH